MSGAVANIHYSIFIIQFGQHPEDKVEQSLVHLLHIFLIQFLGFGIKIDAAIFTHTGLNGCRITAMVARRMSRIALERGGQGGGKKGGLVACEFFR